MKALKPSHREKKRYLLIKGKDANKANIEKAILKFVGLLGYAKASPQFVKLTGKNAEKIEGGLVLSVNRSEIDKIRVSLLLSGQNIVISRVSGVLNKL